MKLNEAAKKLKIPCHLLKYWHNIGLLYMENAKMDFSDLLRARFIYTARKQSISLQTIRHATRNNPNWHIKLMIRDGEIIMKDDQNLLELAETGQLLLFLDKKDDTILEPLFTSLYAKKEMENHKKRNDIVMYKLEQAYYKALERKDVVKVEIILKRMVKIDENLFSAWVELGNFYFSQNKNSKARHAYERCLKIDPVCVEALYNLANLHFKSKCYGASIRYFKECVTYNPYFYEAYYNYGLVMYHLGRLEEAIELLEIYLANDEDSFWASQACQLLEDMQSSLSLSECVTKQLRIF